MKIGLVVNPCAGLGGPAGLKGSDHIDTVQIASARGVESQIATRLAPLLEVIAAQPDAYELVTVAADMGGIWCEEAKVSAQVLDMPIGQPTTPADTRSAVKQLSAQHIDLLVFAGGDGTARDVVDALAEVQLSSTVPVLGIPCGVKMHSGVFANNPTAAANIIQAMAAGQLHSAVLAEVRDIDEEAFQRGVVRAKFYGELWVPETLHYMQQVKSGGKEVEALVVEDIAAFIVENMAPELTYFVGSGSTTAAVMENLGLDNTLLGVDVVKDGQLLLSDAYEAQLFALAEAGDCRMIITVIGGQGHVFGRGNQQFSARVIEAVGLDNIQVIATKSKLEALPDGLKVDTGSVTLDKKLAGLMRVITGYDDAVFCQVQG